MENGVLFNEKIIGILATGKNDSYPQRCIPMCALEIVNTF